MKLIKNNKPTLPLIIILLISFTVVSAFSEYILILILGPQFTDMYISSKYSGLLSACIFLQVFFIYIYIKAKQITYIKNNMILFSIGMWIFCIGFILL